ncbi:TPA: type II toxin-antitoxin system HicA family toxin [Escherichia coli]
MKSADVIAILKQHGWEHIRTRGSHHQFRHPVHPGLVTVPPPCSSGSGDGSAP